MYAAAAAPSSVSLSVYISVCVCVGVYAGRVQGATKASRTCCTRRARYTRSNKLSGIYTQPGRATCVIRICVEDEFFSLLIYIHICDGG